MDEFIKEYGGLILCGLGTIIVVGGFVAVLMAGVGDIAANFLSGIL